jgi:hypothetical protein
MGYYPTRNINQCLYADELKDYTTLHCINNN